MRFRLLGWLEVRRDGRPIQVAGRRQRILLAALLLHPNQVVSVDLLTEFLWPKEAPASGAALQMQVSRLRRALGEEPERSEPRLETCPPGYVLHVGDDELDVIEFERLWTLGHQELAAGHPEAAAAALRRALFLRRGAPLADFQYDDFAQPTITRFRELLLTAQEDRIEADLALGGHTALVSELEMLVRQEPLRERLSGQLVLALYRAGRQEDALGAYERLRRRLADELGAQPSPDLQRIAQAVLDQDPALEVGRGAAIAPSGAPVDSGRRLAPRSRPATIPAADVFAGRAGELAAVLSHLDAAWGGDGRLVLMAGEPGIGKTRLAEEVAAVARGRGAYVQWGRCHEGRGMPPYWPWLQILGAYVTEAGVDALRQAAGARAPDLAPVLAELATPGQQAGSQPDEYPETVRFRMFDALTIVLSRVAETTPVVLVLDDLQWADRASLRVLEFVAQRLDGVRALLIGAYRDRGLGPDLPLTRTLGDVLRSPATFRMHLAGIDEADCAVLARAIAGPLSSALIAAVQRKTDGNPFFVREIIHLLDSEGRLNLPEGLAALGAGVPPAVREVVARRCAGMSEGARQLLSVGSVIGREFDLDLVTQVVPTLDSCLVDAVEELIAAGVVSEVSHRAGRCRFSHDIVRDTLYLELSRIRRAHLHGRVGEALERLEGGFRPSSAELADHFCIAAEGRGDRLRAVEHCLRAGADATRALAYEDAVRHCQRALSILDLGAAIDGRSRRCDILLQLGDALWRAGEVRRARATFLEAAELARNHQRWDALVEALYGYGGGVLRDWHTSREPAGARLMVLLQEALDRLQPGDSSQRVMLLARLAEELYYTDEVERRLSLSGDAVDMARRLNDRASLLSALCSRCLTLWDPDHVDERHRLAREVVDVSERIEDRQLGLFGRHHLYIAQLEIGDGAGASSTLRTFREAAEERRQVLYRWQARWLAALQALVEGAWGEAERLAAEALEMGQQASDPDAMPIFAVQLGSIRLEQGRLAEVADAVEAMADEFVRWPAWRAGQALVSAKLGRREEAAARFESLAADGFDSIPRDFAWLAALAMLTLTCSFLGDAARAAALYRLLLPFARYNAVLADRSYWGSVSHYLGVLAVMAERWAEADAHFEASADMNRRMRAAPWVAHTLYEHARMLGLRAWPGDRERATRRADEARALASALGMAPLLERLNSRQPC